jgi:defect-in-organelle-trafficking protein DotD
MVEISMAITRLRLAPALLGLMALAGCAGSGPTTAIVTTGMPNPEIALRRSMEQVSQHMAQLGELNRPTLAAGQGPVVPEELRRPVAFTWNGALADGVRKLAGTIGYSVVVIGVERPQPVPVAVNLPSTTLIDAFAALGEQAGAYATVQLDPATRTVQVMHHV